MALLLHAQDVPIRFTVSVVLNHIQHFKQFSYSGIKSFFSEKFIFSSIQALF